MTTPNESELRPLHQDMDAQRWAREFTETWKQVVPNFPPPDEGWMHTWFANAIMCGYDEAARRRGTPAPQPNGEAELLAKLEAVKKYLARVEISDRDLMMNHTLENVTKALTALEQSQGEETNVCEKCGSELIRSKIPDNEAHWLICEKCKSGELEIQPKEKGEQ